MQQIGFFIAKFIFRSTCFGHHYAHHQELKIYTDSCCLWYLALSVYRSLVWCGAVGYVSGLRGVSLCPSSGAQELYRWLLPVVLGAFDLQVVGLVWSCGLCVRFAGYFSTSRNTPQTHSSTPDQRPVNQSAKYHRQQPSV